MTTNKTEKPCWTEDHRPTLYNLIEAHPGTHVECSVFEDPEFQAYLDELKQAYARENGESEPLSYINREHGLSLYVGQRVMTPSGPGTVMRPRGGFHEVHVLLDHPVRTPSFRPADVRPLCEVHSDQA